MTKSKTSTRTQSNTILAIDPGFDRVGIAVLSPEGRGQKLLHSECLETKKSLPREARLFSLGLRIKEVIALWQPTELAIEKLFFNQNTSSALGVAEARGIIIFQAMEAGMTVHEYSPQDVKIAVTSYGKADKSQMEFMTRKLVKIEDSKKKKLDDELDAIAVGITHLASRKSF